MPTPAAHRQTTVAPRASWLPWALLTGGVLALAGGLSHRHALSLAAAVVLLLAWLPSAWRRRSPAALMVWAALAVLLLAPALAGHPELALMALPVVFLAAAAWLFARTLKRGAEPLVTRCVRLIEGEARLAQAGVRAYTRGVTVFWGCLLGALALLSLLIAVFAVPGGWLATFGATSPVALPGSFLAWYPEAGCWIALVAGFAGEYLFRRWHLRHLPHLSARQFVTRMVRCWPALVRGQDGGT